MGGVPEVGPHALQLPGHTRCEQPPVRTTTPREHPTRQAPQPPPAMGHVSPDVPPPPPQPQPQPQLRQLLLQQQRHTIIEHLSMDAVPSVSVAPLQLAGLIGSVPLPSGCIGARAPALVGTSKRPSREAACSGDGAAFQCLATAAGSQAPAAPFDADDGPAPHESEATVHAALPAARGVTRPRATHCPRAPAAGRSPFSDIVSRINLLSPIMESPGQSQFSYGEEEEGLKM